MFADNEIRERICAMGSKIAPVTPNLGLRMSYDSAFDYDQFAQMFFVMKGMPIAEARAKANQAVAKISQDRLNSRGGSLAGNFMYLDQQIAIAQFMKASILIVQKFARLGKCIILVFFLPC